MKFRNIIFLFIAAVIAIAFITKPGQEDFQKFYTSQQKTFSSPPVIDFDKGFLYSKATVNYFAKAEMPSPTNEAIL